ncbi:Pyrroline-5-carboxylate reductase [Sedimentisphaera cyanobacteriorum]|uniref:Pyrroline-5-carboxylate reductase n=1 Tax=Sedimentisphaera cyanobacteriorum TaxID=1940790 RepID=A0A1Q2HQS6_9BACT|nr:pyrroline-5-carboxylate reductase [Sedimentisphaera cyanobacteriorum]AQQ09593.1 Pyrroline-5-carboxylate reductase [Sedimentisphaera cyanobacteriorum]
MATIGFIGAGNMAEAIIKGLISKKVYSCDEINISDISDNRLDYMKSAYGINAFKYNNLVVSSSDMAVLAVKPQIAGEVLESLDDFPCDKPVISIAAGLKIKKITDLLGDIPVIRVMPNTPALVGWGAAGLFANKKGEKHLPDAQKIFSAIGEAFVLSSEEDMNIVTALSGSGPAYFFLFMEEMINAAVELGLDEKTASELTMQTALGAAMLAKHRSDAGEKPEDLRRKVASPGGTTEAALKELENNQLGAIVMLAVSRAKQRSEELSEV